MIRPGDIEKGFDLESLLSRHGDMPAIEAGSTVITYSGLAGLVDRASVILKKNSIGEGDWIALHTENSPLHAVLLLACWNLKALFVPVHPDEPLRTVMNAIPAHILVTPETAGEKGMRIIGTGEFSGDIIPMDRENSISLISLEQNSSVIYTSGSTGSPRGVVHTVGNFIYSAMGTIESLGVDEHDRWLASLPMNHVGGLLIFMRTMLSGAALVFPGGGPAGQAIEATKPTILSLVPTQLMRFMKSDRLIHIMKDMKAILLGGAPAPTWLIDSALDNGIPIVPTYGSTESCAQATAVPINSPRGEYHTSGRPLPYREVSISIDGRVTIKGRTVFKGYVNHGRNIEINTGDEFITSDLGEFDSVGNLIIHGRCDQVFISGGENINPHEIENHLRNIENIMDAAVIPVPDIEYGMVPWAFVKTTGRLDEDAIKEKLRLALPGYKVPKRIIALGTGGDEDSKFSRKNLMELARSMAGGMDDAEDPSQL